MKHIICLDKDDIITAKYGNNISVQASDNLEVNFTREALEELIKDYEEIKKGEKIA